MDAELEALIKAWDAFVTCAPREADQWRQLYQSRLGEVAAAHRVPQATLDRAVQRAYQRWQWADDPKFPRDLRKIKLQ